MENVTKKESQRDGTIDTLKGILIFLVVFGHLIRGDTSASINVYGISHYLIYGIHMPLFILISGMVSKDKYAIKSIIKSLLIPYIIVNIIAVVIQIVLGTFEWIDLITPYEVTWYILTLAVYRIISGGSILKKIIICIISICASIFLASISKNIWMIFSIGRIFLLYPLFFVGRLINVERVYKYRNKKWLGVCLLIIGFGLVLTALFTNIVPVTWATHDYPGEIYNVLIKYGFFIVSLVILLGALLLLPKHGSFIERWGRNSIVVYLVHIFVCDFIHRLYPSFALWFYPIALLISVLLVDFLSREFVSKIYNSFMQLIYRFLHLA